jgi:isopropylmalate/homocitrate/citramalate synthase
VTEIAKRARTSTICGLARANFKDIDRCWEAVKHARSPRIHTFIGTSPLHRAIPNLDMDQMAERIHQTVTHARNLCDNVQWSPMDATRTEHDYLCRVVEIAIHHLRDPLPQRPWHGDGELAGGGRGWRATDRMHDQRPGRAGREHGP